MKQFSAFVMLLSVVCGATAQAKSLEIPAIQVVPIQDSATGRDYELYIKLPEEYDPNGDKTHPVIYIADALWNIEIISGSIGYLIKDAILVGVSWEKDMPVQQSRMRDYTPIEYTGADYKHPTGKAHEHLAFFQDDVFKYVESKFKADPGRRSYFGYSASGTFGSYILLTRPHLFENYILGSPATLFGDLFAHEYEPIAKTIPESLHANVFVSVGSDEEPKHIENAISLVRFLKSKKASESKVALRIIESADHDSAFPSTAVQSLYWLAEVTE
jgi:predicted alpha/beta superfamily hydrolase